MPDYVMNSFVYNTKGDSVKLASLFNNEKKNLIDFSRGLAGRVSIKLNMIELKG